MSINEAYLRPGKLLQRYSGLYPDAWRQVAGFRSLRGRDAHWPDWCYHPLKYTEMIIRRGHGKEEFDTRDIGTLTALAAWRATKGVYSFDQTVLDAVWDTPLTGDIPSDVLFHLPEWCVYIPTPGKSWGADTPLHGFFAYLECNVRRQLELVLDLDDVTVPLSIPMDEGSITDALTAVLNHRRSLGVKMPEGWVEDIETHSSPMVSLVVYLCSEAAEMRDAAGTGRMPTRPMPRKTKKGMREFPSEFTTHWEVGYRIGPALRKACESYDESSGVGGRKRPHIRRAHYHTYWTGKRGSERTRMVKWMAPMPINVKDVEDLVPTVRNV